MSGAAEISEAVRAACIAAALRSYEDAGLRGICAEGRLELAIDAIRGLDLGPVICGVTKQMDAQRGTAGEGESC